MKTLLILTEKHRKHAEKSIELAIELLRANLAFCVLDSGDIEIIQDSDRLFTATYWEYVTPEDLLCLLFSMESQERADWKVIDHDDVLDKAECQGLA